MPALLKIILLGLALLAAAAACAPSAPAPRLEPPPLPAPTDLTEPTDFPREFYEPSPKALTPDAGIPLHGPPSGSAATLTPAYSAAPADCPNRDALPRPVAPAPRVLLPILMYHHVQVLPPTASAIWRGLTVTPEAFEAQVSYLDAHNYHTVYFSELVAYFRDGRSLPENPIILTFDDAWREDYTVVYPTLRKYCLFGTFFPPINWIGHSATTLTWAQVEEMSAGGMEFGSHTVNHYLLPNETPAQIREQLVNSRTTLEEILRQPVVVLAYPGGAFNAQVVQLLPETGYGAAAATTAGLYQDASSIFTLHRTAIRYTDDLAAFIAKITPAR